MGRVHLALDLRRQPAGSHWTAPADCESAPIHSHTDFYVSSYGSMEAGSFKLLPIHLPVMVSPVLPVL
jgi:hypothetical protein